MSPAFEHIFYQHMLRIGRSSLQPITDQFAGSGERGRVSCTQKQTHTHMQKHTHTQTNSIYILLKLCSDCQLFRRSQGSVITQFAPITPVLPSNCTGSKIPARHFPLTRADRHHQSVLHVYSQCCYSWVFSMVEE